MSEKQYPLTFERFEDYWHRGFPYLDRLEVINREGQSEAALSGYTRPSLLLRRAPTTTPTLTDINFSLGRGEVLGVIGESGSGKTTLGGLVTGFLAPERGVVRFDGVALAGRAAARSIEHRRRIQMVFQDPLSLLNPRRRVGDQVAHPLRLFHGLDQRKAEARTVQLFEELGLGAELLTRFPRQLSGGATAKGGHRARLCRGARFARV